MSTFAEWRAQVDKELAGASFEKLIHRVDGLAIQPLYTERVASVVPAPSVDAFEICMRVDPVAAANLSGGSIAAHAAGAAARARGSARAAAIKDDLDGGAQALWVADGDRDAIAAALAAGAGLVVDAVGTPRIEQFKAVMHARRALLGFDPIDEVWRGELDASNLPRRLNELGSFVAKVDAQRETGSLGKKDHAVRVVRISTLPYHAAGGDAAIELAIVLAAMTTYMRAFEREGVSPEMVARNAWVQIAVGRDTFGELCKLRALRVVWAKLFGAAGVTAVPEVHAVCSSRTQSLRDSWVNMLRVTTEVFAAVLGGAHVVTPLAFDEAFGVVSPLGRRAARNTALVLREESHLGRVIDAAGGSYYVEARTDALAREAWSRFQAIERAGGLITQVPAMREALEALWTERAQAIAKRKEPVLGVNEFANLDEKLPAPLPASGGAGHRDAEAFETLRARVEGKVPVTLFTLGPASEHRGRLGYAQAFFAVAGWRTAEVAFVDKPESVAAAAPNGVAAICGSDERYAAEAVVAARALRTAGYKHVVLAGRGGTLEKSLREAGVDTFIFVGCDVLATLGGLS
ncbi:MAG: methylmalonyl-CoA mutase family protein [Kofleriaceae bacterium]